MKTMSEQEQKKAPDLFQASPEMPFYVVADEDLNGGIDFDCEGKEPMDFANAMLLARDRMRDDGCQYVVECRCIRKLRRGPIRVTEIAHKASDKRR